MAAENAMQLKDKGNAFFKSGQMKQAVECYAKAEDVARDDPVYPSNLSAALYETGDYLGSVQAIFRSWKILSQGSNPTLALKLSIRIAKALIQGVRGGSVTSDVLKDNAQIINQLEAVAQQQPASASSSIPDHIRVWKDWKQLENEAGDRKEAALQARSRLSQLPVFRKPVNPRREYYTIGQDSIMSLFSDWGPEAKYPLKIEQLSTAQLSNISFLFGGIGDARHAYGTLIGAHRAFLSLNKRKRSQFYLHMTLLDVHPGALARNLCIMMLIHALSDGSQSATNQIEIKATIFYTYVGVVLPGYCYERLYNTMQDIKVRLSKDPPEFPDWLHVDSASIADIITSLDYWSKLTDSKTTAGMLRFHVPHTPGTGTNMEILNNPNISPEYRAKLQDSMVAKRQQIGDMLDSMDDSLLRQAGWIEQGQTPAQAREFLTQHREEAIELMLKAQLDGNVTSGMDKEQEWYNTTKTFMPPAELWNRHPGYANFRRFQQGKTKLPKEVKTSIKGHIETTWKPNVTLFDQASTSSSITNWSATGYPNLTLDAFKACQELEEYNDRFKLGGANASPNPDAPAYSHTTRFFDGVVEALKGMKGHITVEVLRGELVQEMSKMRFRGDGSRPATFPRSFTRAWLSNVPDYTHGLMSTCVYALPAIQNGDASAVASNCLLNSGIWKDDEEFCHTYTLLRTQDVPRYLGCRLIRKDGVMGLIVLGPQPLPRPLSELASREEVITWLTRVFLCTVVPGSSGLSAFRARLPNNLVAFVELLIHLQEVGFPSHWLSDFLQSILSDSLVTNIAPYQGKWPIPVSEITRRVKSRKVRLDPWCAELETILATAYEGIPFMVPLPSDFASTHAGIGIYEAKLEEASYGFGFLPNLLPTDDPVVFLMLYRPGPDIVGPKELVHSVPALLEGLKKPAPGNMFILTAQDVFDLPGKKVRWRISRKRARMMKEQGWCLVAYRTDTQEPFTHPVPASQWKDVDPVSLPFLEILPVD